MVLSSINGEVFVASSEANFEILVFLSMCFGIAFSLFMIIRPDLFIRFGYGLFLDLKEEQRPETLMLFRGLGLLILLPILGIFFSQIS